MTTIPNRIYNYAPVAAAIRQAVPPGARVFLGPDGDTAYFALLGRNPMRCWVPVPLPNGAAHRNVAAQCDYILVSRPATYLPDVEALLGSRPPVTWIGEAPGPRISVYRMR